MRITHRGKNCIWFAILFIWALAILVLWSGGDPCDMTNYPDQCRMEVPER